MTSELVIGSINPIYLRSFVFSSANFGQIELKAQIYQSHSGATLPEKKHSTFLGQVEFKIEELAKLRSQVGMISFQLRNELK